MSIFDLFRPKWKHSNWLVRKTAVKELIDQALLADIAESDKNRHIRLTAVEKISDQCVLAEIAKKEREPDVRIVAVYRLTDQTVLAEIAKQDSDEEVRKAAVKKLIDQPLLADIAESDRDKDVRLVAVEKITHQGLLTDIVKTGGIANIREAAVKKLVDQPLLQDLARTDKICWIREAAVKNPNLTDQAVLTEIAKTANDWESIATAEAAVMKITDQTLLAEIAKRASEPRVRRLATTKITDQILLTEITKYHEVNRTINKMRTYHNKKWNMRFEYPEDWDVVWENEPDGGWEIIVCVAGKPSGNDRPSVAVRIKQHAILNFGPANIDICYAEGSRSPIVLPRTPEEYNEQCNKELKNILPGFRFISGESGTLAGMHSGTLYYSYDGKSGTIREKQVNLFGKAVTYRLLCETPIDQSESVEKYFDKVVADFNPFTGKGPMKK